MNKMSQVNTKSAGVTVIGLGQMGSALAKAFLTNGYPTTVWNRSPEKAKDLVAQGAAYTSDVAEAVAANSLVVICVLDYQAVHEILDTVGSTLSDRTLVNLTNGSPEQARLVEERVTRLGVEYLDGGIMAVPSLIARPEAVLLYSGSQKAFETHQQTLDSLGSSKYLGTDSGLAALHDLALLSGMYGMFGGFIHSVALVGSEKVNATKFTSELLIPWLHAMITTMPKMAQQIDSGDYTTQDASLEMQASLDTIGDVSRAQGISTELSDPIFSLMRRRVADGHGGDDISSVIELLRQPTD
jgi:3-hydroxyisobutyrate dehydrogenase-like beta-hydroxyacid dehydrogenase